MTKFGHLASLAAPKAVALRSLGLALTLAACGGQAIATGPSSDAGPTADAATGADAAPWVSPYAAQCANSPVPAVAIECTGLYADLAAKRLAPDVREYAPATPLWSDGAEKTRWISLPAGATIDASDPNEWKFPVGTRVWKQFVREGRRIETRLFHKVDPRYWERTTYRWNDTETAATQSLGGDQLLPSGAVYHIPTSDECDQCHIGRTDHLLGFEAVSLGLAGATGITLADLVAEGRIQPPPASTSLAIGDDGTGVAAAPLAWIHVNCGVTCHNGNSNSTAYGAGMRLRLDVTQLDGRGSAGFDSRVTTMGVKTTTPTWAGQTRIVPGDPQDSLLVKLITNRGTDNPANNQMPPIASVLVDQPDTQKVVDWITKMASLTDAGADAAPVDAAAPADAGAPSDASAD